MLYLKCETKSNINMENTNNKMDSSEQYVTAIKALKEDKVFTTVMSMVFNVASKIANYIDKFEGIMTENDGDTACITININYFTDIEPFYIGCFTEDVIYVCNMKKPQYELINIELFDNVVILKVKV